MVDRQRWTWICWRHFRWNYTHLPLIFIQNFILDNWENTVFLQCLNFQIQPCLWEWIEHYLKWRKCLFIKRSILFLKIVDPVYKWVFNRTRNILPVDKCFRKITINTWRSEMEKSSLILKYQLKWPLIYWKLTCMIKVIL